MSSRPAENCMLKPPRNRPTCMRCRSLDTECYFSTEEGESRWSALRRKNHVLLRERDEARELVALIHSRPRVGAEELYRDIRGDTHSDDIGTLIRKVLEAFNASVSSQQRCQHQNSFSDDGSNPPNTEAVPHLPPSRSVVKLPPVCRGANQRPSSQPFLLTRQASRAGGLVSAVPSASDTSMPSLGSSEQHSLSAP